MRRELEEILGWGLDKINKVGRTDYGRLVNKLKPTEAERREIVERFRTTDDGTRISLLAAIMDHDPCETYRVCVTEALESENADRRWFAMETLLEWKDPEALDLLFAKPHVQEAMGDLLAERLEPWAAAKRLTGPMQQQVLDLFVARFEGVSEIDWNSRPWFDLLARLDVTNDKVAETLGRLWEALPRSDVYERYNLLLAMTAKPLPVYEPLLRKAKKSKVEDLRDLGRAGLAKLSEA